MSLERERTPALSTGPSSFGDAFGGGGAAVAEARVDVIHGVYAHSLPLAGMTVGRARAELSERMNIAPDALAVVDGVEVSDDTVLHESQVLNFVKHAGEKG